MKILTLLSLTFLFATSSTSLIAQTCTADATVTLTGNPGEVSIVDNSTVSSGAVFSWIDFVNMTTGQNEGSHYFQSAGSPTTETFTENGVYKYYVSVEDTLTGCYDSIGGTFTISGLPNTCSAAGSVTLTGNPGEVQVIDNSTTSSGPSATISYVDIYNTTPSWNYLGRVNLQPTTGSATFQLPSNGSYYYYLSVEDTITNCFDSIGGPITINNVVSSCDASFYAGVDSINCYQLSYDAYNLGYSDYFWDFGDGNNSQNTFGTHTYAAAGTYTIELAVYDYDSLGNYLCGDTVYQTITVNCNGCYANANVSVTQTGTPGLLAINDYSTSSTSSSVSWVTFYDQGGNWLGNVPLQPSTTTGTFQVPTNGIYSYSFVVQDSLNNCEDSISNYITVNGFTTSACDADFNYYPDSISNGIHFNAPTHAGSGFSYHWDFGDGNTSYIADPNHNYGSNGTYTACLTVWNSNTFCADTVCKTITVSNGGAAGCVGNAYFNYNTNNGYDFFFAPNTILSNASYNWDFGNGNSSSVAVTQQTYNAPTSGWVAVCLLVVDANNCTDYYCDSVYVNAPASGPTCDATFYGYPDSSIANSVQFYPYGSNSAGATYTWNFGDGTTGTGQYPTHTYAASGWYAACLTVSNGTGAGCSQTYCDSVYADGGLATSSCNASYILFQDSTGSGVYYAWNTSTGNNLSYFWDFGDGNTSTTAFPTHTYSSVGLYSICLSVSDNSGCTSTFCDTIYIVVKAAGTTLNVLKPGVSVGVEELSVFNEVNLYPNPTNGEFNLSINAATSSEVSIIITNLTGQTVESTNLQLNQGDNVINMNESHLSSGIYLVNLINESTGEFSSMKLIKE